MRKFAVILASLACLFTAASCDAKSNEPEVKGWVTDYTGTLSKEQVASLSTKLEEHFRQTSNQIAVVIIDSVGEDNTIEKLSLKTAEKWKGGQKGKDNGLLIFVAKNDKAVRFETGYGLEGVLPDGAAGSIIRNDFRPDFKEGRFFEGLDKGIGDVFLAVKGEYKFDANEEARLQTIEKKENMLLYVLGGVLVVSAIFCLMHRAAGGTVGAIGAGIAIYWVYGAVLFALLACALGFVAGLISPELLRIGLQAMASGRGGGSGWSGGGGKFGGGGATGRW